MKIVKDEGLSIGETKIMDSNSKCIFVAVKISSQNLSSSAWQEYGSSFYTLISIE